MTQDTHALSATRPTDPAAPLHLHLLVMKAYGGGEMLTEDDLRDAGDDLEPTARVVAAGSTSQYGMVELVCPVPAGTDPRTHAWTIMTTYALALEGLGDDLEEEGPHTDGVVVAYAGAHWAGSEMIDMLTPTPVPDGLVLSGSPDH